MAERTRRGPVVLDGASLTLAEVAAVADGARCSLDRRARRRVRDSRAVVERALDSGRQIYGVNTGFGKLSSVRIDDADLERLQLNLVRSHSAGIGEPLPDRAVRAALVLRANCLARGHSGVRLETLEAIVGMLAAGIVPVVPAQGSVTASGDLAPLAHLALALVGEGRVRVEGRETSAAAALRRAGLAPVRLRAKEGLALINGTQVTTALGILGLIDAERLATAADLVGAMSLEALRGSHRAFDRRLHAARPHRGQLTSAANLRRLLRRSTIERSHRDCGQVQDSYSLRCIPQVHGAARDGMAHVRGVLEIEANASTDNPMVFAEEDLMISGGNFHGHPVALALDHLAIASAALGTIAERRIERLLNPDLSGLPAFLTHDAGLHSGFMMAHVTAAALVSENKVLAHPASVDTIPTSAGKEDHVPMGAHAARKAAQVVDHVAAVLGIELLCAAQALDLLAPLRGGSGVEAARRALRRRIRGLGEDRVLSPDLEAARTLVLDGSLVRAAESAAGTLR